MKSRYYFLLILVCATLSSQAQQTAGELRTLIVFFDGLRPDYITEGNMPNLFAFKNKAAYGRQHHSVFPTVTRVNASSYSTGSYPGTHGLMGNSVYFPQVNKAKALNTGNALEVDEIAKATGDKVLTAASLAELLQQAGSSMMVFSSGTTGQALMQNHKISGGAVVNPDLIRPESFKDRVLSEIGTVQSAGNKHIWVANALMKYGLRLDGPKVSAIWFGDPDGTAHRDGIGTATAMAAIKTVDEQFGRILADIEAKGLANNFNILISSDHGFVTDIGKEGLGEFLISQGLKKDQASDDVVLAGGAIYVKDSNRELISKIVLALQQQEWVGGIFTPARKAGDTKGWVPGTLSFDAIHWDHPERSSDILVDVNWNDAKNDKGYAGSSFARGVAGHGGFSPYEVRIPLIAYGPGFKKGYESDLPTSNVDLVPTILHLHKIAIPEQMDGRVMHELLTKKSPASAPTSSKVRLVETSTKTPRGKYTLILEQSVLGRYIYLNSAKVVRD
ncbi:MAG: alkaline phosphatase family protein [Daejeonella sp.]|uniref:alkaline phosphatase family protein n=1 Tax=Daejeonella sp. JGW-45 TaxID=3034148 RepID=UPI0023EC59A1|nr:alkaline phosphatase family protein [Daejeonella sp. JGW-45]